MRRGPTAPAPSPLLLPLPLRERVGVRGPGPGWSHPVIPACSLLSFPIFLTSVIPDVSHAVIPDVSHPVIPDVSQAVIPDISQAVIPDVINRESKAGVRGPRGTRRSPTLLRSLHHEAEKKTLDSRLKLAGMTGGERG